MGMMDTIKLYSNFIRLRVKNGSPRMYDLHWEKFWATVGKTGQNGEVVWDSTPELAAAEDLPRFQQYMDRTVPILDLGCGNGRQSRYLAQFFDKVIGADVAPSAIDIARKETTEEKNVVYRVLDAVSPEQAKKFHDEFGDVNVYIRTVMHVIQKVDRPKFVESLRILLGEKGVLYQIELLLAGAELLPVAAGQGHDGPAAADRARGEARRGAGRLRHPAGARHPVPGERVGSLRDQGRHHRPDDPDRRRQDRPRPRELHPPAPQGRRPRQGELSRAICFLTGAVPDRPRTALRLG